MLWLLLSHLGSKLIKKNLAIKQLESLANFTFAVSCLCWFIFIFPSKFLQIIANLYLFLPYFNVSECFLKRQAGWWRRRVCVWDLNYWAVIFKSPSFLRLNYICGYFFSIAFFNFFLVTTEITKRLEFVLIMHIILGWLDSFHLLL